MFKKFISMKTATVLLSLILIVGASFSAKGQKHGKDNGGGKHGGEDRDRIRGNGDGKHGDGENRDRDERRQYEQSQIPQAIYNTQRQDRGDKHGNGNGRKNRDDDRRSYPVYQPQVTYGGGWVPPGQNRSREVHERNDQRKAWKDQEKAYRRWNKNEDREDRRDQRQAQYAAPQWWEQARRIYHNDYSISERRTRQYAPVDPYSGYSAQPNYGVQYDRYIPNRNQAGSYNGYDPYSYDNGYANNYSNNGGSNWKSVLLRTLIGTVLSGLSGGKDGYDSQTYYQPNYSQSPYNFAGYAPQYAAQGQDHSSYGQSDSYGDQSNYGGLLGGLPLAEVFSGGNDFGGILSGGLSQFLAQGYLQGLNAGDTARSNNYGERFYNDPYVTDAGVYDQGSSTIADNRRLLSEGYALGYQDALNGRGQYDGVSGGRLDLVSVLLSDVFKLG